MGINFLYPGSMVRPEPAQTGGNEDFFSQRSKDGSFKNRLGALLEEQ